MDKITSIDIIKDYNGQTDNTSQDMQQKMSEKMNIFCSVFETSSNDFDEIIVLKDILDYLEKYDRILYAPISNRIYACYDKNGIEGGSNTISTMLSNIDSIITYINDIEKSENIESIEKDSLRCAKKTILKIGDHISLAQQQYNVLKQSDEDYKSKFDKSIMPIVNNITKDMNAQLLTMVGIFTALAFLIFGGISSLDNIFSNPKLPLMKLMIIGSVWGICILNLVFVFLICVGKMTKLNFESSEKNDTIFQKYAVVWWTNLIIFSIMIISIWGYYLVKTNVYKWVERIFKSNPVAVTLIGSIIILFTIILIAYKLMRATKF